MSLLLPGQYHDKLPEDEQFGLIVQAAQDAFDAATALRRDYPAEIKGKVFPPDRFFPSSRRNVP